MGRKAENLCCSYNEDHRDSTDISFLNKNYQQPGKFSNPQISLKAQIIHLCFKCIEPPCSIREFLKWVHLLSLQEKPEKLYILRNQSPDACWPSGTVVIICSTTELTDQNTVLSHLLTDVAILRPPTGHVCSAIVTWINISYHHFISMYYIFSYLCISSQRNSPFLSVHSRQAYYYISVCGWETCIKLCKGCTILSNIFTVEDIITLTPLGISATWIYLHIIAHFEVNPNTHYWMSFPNSL